MKGDVTANDPFLDLVRATFERLPDPGPRDRADATYLVAQISGIRVRPETVRFAVGIFDSIDSPGARRACALLETEGAETRVIGPARLTPDMVAAPLAALAGVRLVVAARQNGRDGQNFRVHVSTGDRSVELSFGSASTRDPALVHLGRVLDDYATWLATVLPTAR